MRVFSVVVVGCLAVVGCRARGRPVLREGPPAATVAVVASSPPPPPPVRVETVPVEGDHPAFVVRAAPTASAPRLRMLFVPGMCVHPGGYVEAFQYAAAARGDLVTLQGDVSCGGNGFARKWSGDLEAMDRRIDAAFVASGLGEPRDVVVIGYSQGAERAERLVARYPAKYASAVLLASPIVPAPRDFAKAHAVVFMAGTFDGAQASMRGAVAPFRRAGLRAEYFELPEARHGQMGTAPEETMAKALDFVGDPEKM